MLKTNKTSKATKVATKVASKVATKAKRAPKVSLGTLAARKAWGTMRKAKGYVKGAAAKFAWVKIYADRAAACKAAGDMEGYRANAAKLKIQKAKTAKYVQAA